MILCVFGDTYRKYEICIYVSTRYRTAHGVTGFHFYHFSFFFLVFLSLSLSLFSQIFHKLAHKFRVKTRLHVRLHVRSLKISRSRCVSTVAVVSVNDVARTGEASLGAFTHSRKPGQRVTRIKNRGERSNGTEKRGLHVARTSRTALSATRRSFRPFWLLYQNSAN